MPSHRVYRHLMLMTCFVLGLIVLVVVNDNSDVRAGENTEEVDNSNLYDELRTFTDVLALVQRDYVREVGSKKLVEGAIKGMLATLDPHSGYLDPDFYQDLQVQTRGEFGGLGIEITIRDGLLIVVAPMEGSPAAQVGIRPGDAIVKIDGKFAKEFSLVDAVKKLRGPKGSAVMLSISRKGHTDLLEFKVVRDNIAVRSVRSRYIGDGYGYVRVSQFMEKTTEDLRSELDSLRKQNGNKDLRGLILDMRNNPGGLLTQAIGVADLFLKQGVIVYTDGRVEKQRQRFFAHERGTEPEYPMIVLVNGGSASAAEIVAGAVKDHGRGLVLGTKTFGKGSVQTISPLQNGGAVTLTTALYYTKSGRSIQATGIVPDIEMENPPLESPDQKLTRGQSRIRPMREEDLPGAIENPSGSGTKDKGAEPADSSGAAPQALDPLKEELSVWLERDPQLQRALDLLKTFNIFRTGNPEKILQEVKSAELGAAAPG
ncbi:MAG: S41 family peptidase [Bdellovibrionota bacterium]|nr:MAG: S41 family peptidase [Bdellovibrionota bacterium]